MKRVASRKEKTAGGREEPRGKERLRAGLAGWLCWCVRTSCGNVQKQRKRSSEKTRHETREVKRREDKRSEEGCEQQRKEGKGLGITLRERAVGGRARRLAVLLCVL